MVNHRTLPLLQKEIAYFILGHDNEHRYARWQNAIATNNVEIDHRGLIYIVDRANTALQILELTEQRLGTSLFALLQGGSSQQY